MGRCGIACLKYLLMLFNFIVFVAGITLVAISVWVIVDSSSFQDLVNTEGMMSLFTAVWLIFSIGVALFLLGLMGCYGSAKENRIMLAIFLPDIHSLRGGNHRCNSRVRILPRSARRSSINHRQIRTPSHAV